MTTPRKPPVIGRLWKRQPKGYPMFSFHSLTRSGAMMLHRLHVAHFQKVWTCREAIRVARQQLKEHRHAGS